MADRVDVSDKTAISMPMRNLLSILAAVGIGVYAYFGIQERLNNVETRNILMEADLVKNTEFEQQNKKEVIENQVKMKLDLENIITDVGELRKVIKKLKNKDADIQKTNKKIIKQHDRLFDLIEGNSSSNSSYSYGD